MAGGNAASDLKAAEPVLDLLLLVVEDEVVGEQGVAAACDLTLVYPSRSGAPRAHPALRVLWTGPPR